MKVALTPLAAGALVTWLAAGRFSVLLGENTLPYHKIEALPLSEMIHEVISLPTLIALVVIACGIALWLLRDRLGGLIDALKGVRKISEDSFGFEAVNHGIVNGVQSAAEALRVTQTGLLNWNLVGVVIAVIVLFVFVAMGA